MHVAIDVGRYLGSTGDFLAGITQFLDSFVDFLFKREAEVADVLVFELFVLSRKRRGDEEVGSFIQHGRVDCTLEVRARQVDLIDHGLKFAMVVAREVKRPPGHFCIGGSLVGTILSVRLEVGAALDRREQRVGRKQLARDSHRQPLAAVR